MSDVAQLAISGYVKRSLRLNNEFIMLKHSALAAYWSGPDSVIHVVSMIS